MKPLESSPGLPSSFPSDVLQSRRAAPFAVTGRSSLPIRISAPARLQADLLSDALDHNECPRFASSRRHRRWLAARKLEHGNETHSRCSAPSSTRSNKGRASAQVLGNHDEALRDYCGFSLRWRRDRAGGRRMRRPPDSALGHSGDHADGVRRRALARRRRLAYTPKPNDVFNAVRRRLVWSHWCYRYLRKK